MSHSLHHTDAADTAKLLQELDRDSKSRSLTGGYKTAMTVLFVLYSLTMIVMALVVSGATQYTRLPVFVGMTLFVGYLKYPASKRDALRDNYFPWYDVILAFTSLGVFFYYAIEQKRIIQMANRIGTTQIVLGIIGILLLVELCRRSTGIPLIVVVGLFTVYGAWWLTNNNPKTALRNLIYNLFYNLNCGIFSSPITVCASFIVLFIILGSFLEKTGIGTFFVDLANSIAGASVGGPAKVSIPHFFRLLAKSGYLLIPVVILVICMNYYTAGMSACFAILFALIISLIGRDKRDLLRSVGLPLIPLAVLVVLWQVIKIDTGTAVFVSMVVAVLCSFLTRSAILSPRLVAEGLQGGAGSSIGVAVACAMAGIISGVVSMTALGTTLVAVIVPLAQKSIFLALFCTMLACIVLGMGVPTTANYVIMATITAPILIKMGIPLLAAHMFVFYFGIVADITPPVALAAYAGSAIAHSNPLKTGITATKLAIGAFIIPYIFALNPSLLFIDVESVWALIGIMVTSIIGMAGIAMGMTGHVYAHVPWYMRIMLLAGGIFLIDPSPVSDLIGLLLIGIPFAFQLLQNRKLKATAAE